MRYNLDTSKQVDEIKKEIVHETINHYTNNPDIAELGDYTPFIWYYNNQEWVEKHLKSNLDQIIADVPPGAREDTLLGLIEFYRNTQDKEVYNIICDFFDHIFENYVNNHMIECPYFMWMAYGTSIAKKRPPNKYMKYMSLVANPLFESISSVYSGRGIVFPRNGVFMELLIDLYELDSNDKHLYRAKELADGYINESTFRKYGLFGSPGRISGIRSQARLFKDNIAVMNGIIAVSSKLGGKYTQTINKWVNSVENLLYSDELYGEYNFRKNKPESPKLLYTPPMIDCLCYAYKIHNINYYLEFAKKIANNWINRQTHIGLIPFLPNKNYSHHDSITDISVSLLRLYELTNNSRYRDAALKSISGLYNHHMFNLYTDIYTGKRQGEKVIPRFIPLMLKPLIALENKSIMSGETFKILRDR